MANLCVLKYILGVFSINSPFPLLFLNIHPFLKMLRARRGLKTQGNSAPVRCAIEKEVRDCDPMEEHEVVLTHT